MSTTSSDPSIEDPAPVEITRHALLRFRERSVIAFGIRYSEADARRRLLSFLARATYVRTVTQSDWVGRDRVYKTVNVEHWTAGGWLFPVVHKGHVRVLVTVKRLVSSENTGCR
jgi:hypothetical protein